METSTEEMSSLASSLTNGQSKTLSTRDFPPGVSGKPYVISSQDGEIIYIPLSKSATRLLITGKETDNAFAVVSSGGSQSDPIGFHYHREAHDVFLCLQGSINVWAGDQCRTMSAGDFASVPPNTIHQYQILGVHSEMIGLIVPGGWEEFFRFIGEPYNGPMWPTSDNRNFFEVLLPRLKAAAEQFDMVPCPQQDPFEPQEWKDIDNQLPGKQEPYFLKHASGPAYDVGGTICRPLVTTAESNGKFSIGSVESSSQFHQYSIFEKDNESLCFENVHHAFMVVQGSIEFQLDLMGPRIFGASELIYVPKGTSFRFRTTSRFSKMYAFASGAGLVEIFCKLGATHPTTVLPEKAESVSSAALEALQSQFGFCRK